MTMTAKAKRERLARLNDKRSAAKDATRTGVIKVTPDIDAHTIAPLNADEDAYDCADDGCTDEHPEAYAPVVTRTAPTQEESPSERNLRLLADQRTAKRQPCACGGDDRCEHGTGRKPTKGHKAGKLVTVQPGVNGATSPAKTAKAKRQRSGAVAGAGTNGCLCGCGGATKSRFCPGHDARVYGWLRRGEKLPAILTANPEVLAYMRGMVH